jgi:hypothetical protein
MIIMHMGIYVFKPVVLHIPYNTYLDFPVGYWRIAAGNGSHPFDGWMI